MSASNIVSFPLRPVLPPLHRPRLLIRAAREGQAGWRRERDLPRLLRCDDCPSPTARVLARLRAEEETLNEVRKSGSAEYDLRRHILLLIAILAEMRSAAAQTCDVTRPRYATSYVH